MADFLLPSLAVAAVALLLGAGATHLAHPGRLRVALDRQDLVRLGLRRPLAVLLGGVESAVALAAAVALVTETGSAAAGLAVAAAGAGFSAFLLILIRLRPGAPCGCGGDGEGAVGPADVARSATVLLGGLALAGGAASRLADLASAERATVLLAGVALAAAVDVTARAHRPIVLVAAT
jgi:hypothetical protein